jgi:hypothetical protein
LVVSVIFAEQSSTKERTRQPPPQIRKRLQLECTCARMNMSKSNLFNVLQFILQSYNLQFTMFYNLFYNIAYYLKFFKLRSTTEQMPALVFLQNETNFFP